MGYILLINCFSNNSSKMGQHHQLEGPFTEEEQQLIRLGEEKDLFSSHHHHHHHSTAKYLRPKQLTTPIGLYALKKLNAIEPSYLNLRQKRLLQPVAPGFISYLIYGGFLASMGAYTAFVFRSSGYQGLFSKAMLPVAVLGVGYKVAEYGLNAGRQLLFARQRGELVQKYKNQLGQSYLLDILDPNFRLGNSHSGSH